MGEYQFGTMEAGAATITDYSVNPESTDGPSGESETTYQNTQWSTQFGYYINTTDIQEVVNARARWTIGKGYQADEITIMQLDTIKGFGKDTFNTILENMVRVYHIGGDSYCEIIRDKEDNLINLKPLDPSSIKIVANKQGLITRYEQMSKTKEAPKKFKVDKVFHLPRNRVADEIHGRGMTDVLAQLILAKNEAIADNRKMFHRFVVPQFKFKLKTDDPAEIAAYKAKMDAVVTTGENIYEPYDVAESELLSVAPNATLNPLAWIQYLEGAFYKAAGVPQFIVGGGTGFTEASEKIAYLAWQQTIEEDQLFIEEQILAQLNLVIELEFPASLENELLSDNAKDGPQNIDQSELNPQSENA